MPVNAPENNVAPSPPASPVVTAAEEPSTHRLMIPSPPEVPPKDTGLAGTQVADTEKTSTAEVVTAPADEQVAVVPTNPKVTQDSAPTPASEAAHTVETKDDETIPYKESTSEAKTEVTPESTGVDAVVPPTEPAEPTVAEPTVVDAKVDEVALAVPEAKTESAIPAEGKVDAADQKIAERTSQAAPAEQAQNAEVPEAPATPTKTGSAISATTPSSTPSKKHVFPSSGSPKSTFTDSPPASILGSRKKKGSIFRRISIRGIFGGNKDKEKQ